MTAMEKLSREKLKELLDGQTLRINRPEFVLSDPVQFPRRYSRKQDIEIAAFLAATIAWGKRSMILSSCERMFSQMGGSPYDFVMNSKDFPLKPEKRAVHRTFSSADFVYFIEALRRVYSSVDSLEEFFIGKGGSEITMWEGISNFRKAMMEGCADASHQRHVSDPEKNSAGKRLHLMLRWLVRQDGIVDIGLWKRVKPSRLVIPLDLHVGRTARMLGLTERKANDRKTAEEITDFLKTLDSVDPIKYDFALFGISEEAARGR